MREKMPIEEIRSELEALRGEIGRIGGLGIPSVKGHSDWGAHGKWSSYSKALMGDFDLSTKIGIPTTAAQLDKVITETTSTRFLEVAKSLRDMIAEKK